MPLSIHTQRIYDFPLFKRFESVWTPILSHISVRRFARDEMAVHHGMRASGIWLTLSGWVGLMRTTPDGRESIVGLCGEGDLFGEAGLFASATYPYSARVVQADTELAMIPAELMRGAMEAHPQISRAIMEELNARVAGAQLKLEQMHTLSAAQRIGCFLLRLCRQQTGGSRTLTMPVEKHIVASYLGMKPETLSRGFRQLGAIQVRVQGAAIEIGDVARLRAYVCGSCGESGLCTTEAEIMATACGQTPRNGG